MVRGQGSEVKGYTYMWRDKQKQTKLQENVHAAEIIT